MPRRFKIFSIDELRYIQERMDCSDRGGLELWNEIEREFHRRVDDGNAKAKKEIAPDA